MRTPVFRAVLTRTAPALATVALISGLPAPVRAEQAGGTTPATDEYVLIPDRVFDGHTMREGYGVVRGAVITAVGPAATLPAARRHVLAGATLLPGFIDLHGHVAVQGVPPATVLRHGTTTVRDLTGPARPPAGGNGSLRQLSAGPILTPPHGYPLPVWAGGGGHGHGDASALAVEVADVEQARKVVRHLVDAGASVIKIALEPGGSPGAPWSQHAARVPPPWPLLAPDVLKAIVREAHARGRKVSAHLSNATGARLALDAAVDEWAHMPCEALPEDIIARAVDAGVRIVGALDTLSPCSGVLVNTREFVARGGTLLYGTDMAHTELPWGINARELELMMHASHGKLPRPSWRPPRARRGNIWEWPRSASSSPEPRPTSSPCGATRCTPSSASSTPSW
ncbi:amidohydrolase family protein [Aromatoleum diolicum]|uniref:Amidohydrolase family protein n=1 Tax=Aromatoleum diolicum TaxID=75796 RepID=A0ABX1QBH3_9RHOO|nr:amidohydrolase family protein [Aromatoleum diolicum]NMG75742.1 amidohydrolase family protein [Aromatoleum diolicum]